MTDFLGWLTETSGFVPRSERDEWTPQLVWLHVGSDLLIWLAYLSIPLVLLYFVRRRTDLPFSRLFVLFAAFILACGFSFFIDALLFSHPIYRLAGLVKLLTAAVSWITVLALIPAAPRVLELMGAVSRAAGTPEVRATLTPENPTPARGYIIAILTSAMAILLRRLLDPVLADANPYIIAFPAIIFVAWEAGFVPAILATALNAAAIAIWWLPPKGTPLVEGFENQVGLALFIFSGLGGAMLGEAQRHAAARAERALADARGRQAELEAEVGRRERTEQALRESEARFRNMADSVPSMIWLSDENRRRTYFNRTWLGFTGRPLDEQLGYGWTESVHPDDQALYLRAYESAFDARRPFEVEYRLRRFDGAYRWVLARGTPRFTPGGEFAGFIGLCIDITDRKEAVEALKESEERFRVLTEAIPQLVWNADPAGHATYFNTRWREFTGLTADTAGGEWWSQVVHPDDAREMETAWNRAMAGVPEPFTHEVRVRRAADGAYRWFKTAVVPLRRADGTVEQWIGSLSDIDDQKREAQTLEQLVRERTAELHRSNSELEQFAYVASHDLQEPLRKIQAFGDRLRDRFRAALPDTGRDFLDKMLSSAGRMSKLIDDLLAYSRVTTHARPFTPTDLNATLHDVTDDLETRIERTGATVEVGQLAEIDADPTQMRQLFQNLIGNALKFARPDEPPVVRVRGELLAADAGPPICRIEVADNGIGFDEKYLDRIFQVFQRLHGRGEYEGTGVGLAICKKIVDRHGGTITAHSEPGRGSTFVVLVPTRHPAAATAPAEAMTTG